MHFSRDSGVSWSSLSRGLPTSPVVDLEIDPSGATLVAVTHGLSAFALDVSGLVAAEED